MSGRASEVTNLAVVVVAFGDTEILVDCLRPLKALIGAKVVVVDNASSPVCRDVVESMDFAYVDAGRNLGFGHGVNKGIAHLKCPLNDVLLLNPDAVVSAETIMQLLTKLSNGSGRLAAVAPRQLDPITGAEQRVVWPWPTPGGAWLGAVGLRRRAVAESGFLIGAVLLLKAEALAEVGGFDERFFLYAEETDWQRRAVDLGWGVELLSDAWATHIGAATSSDSVRREYHFHAGTEIYIRKHYGGLGWLSFRTGVILGAFARAGLLRGERRRSAWRRALLYCRGPVNVRSAADA